MLCSLKEVLAEGKKRGIAVGSYNTPNTESLWAVLDAAETLDIPIIIAHAQCHEDVVPLDKIGPLMVAMAKRSRTRVCVHLDHGEDFDYCRRAILLGFTSIMIDCSELPYEENVTMTREVADYAHACGVDVEAELGSLPAREGGTHKAKPVSEQPGGVYTDPTMVPDYLARTGADALAIAFGAVHGLYRKKPVFNMDIITAVRAVTDVPLVMHGGSGVSPMEYREIIRRGIGKINCYSYMAYAGYEAARQMADEIPSDYYHHMARRAEQAMYENALETLKIFSGIN